MKKFLKLIPYLFFILIGWILSNTYHTFQKEKVIPEVGTIKVRKGRIQENIGLTTKVYEKEVRNILSSIEKGICEAIYIKVGDYVQKGQRLMELRKEELVNNLKKEEFNLEQAKEKEAKLADIPAHPEVLEKDEQIQRSEWNLSQQEKSLEDAKELYNKRAYAYRDVEKQDMEVKEARINLERLKREKEQLIKRLYDQKKELEIEISSLCNRISDLSSQIKDCVVFSPISGIVRKVGVEKNNKVEYGTLLLSIGDQSELIARGSLKESNFFAVKEGQRTKLLSEPLGKTFSGRVLRVIPATSSKEEKEAGWEVISSIDNPENLRIGMELSTQVIIKEREEETIVIPPEALYEEGSVLIIKDGRLKKKQVTLGEQTTDQIEVISGLKLGDRVVVQYPEQIEEGMRVRVKSEK
jgi:multidrug efflux pump subunit AcrA (membrane-fusion protein)